MRLVLVGESPKTANASNSILTLRKGDNVHGLSDIFSGKRGHVALTEHVLQMFNVPVAGSTLKAGDFWCLPR